MRRFCRRRSGASLVVLCSTATAVVGQASSSQLDVEVARRTHLQDCEALPQRLARDGPWADLQNDVIELLKSPQVLPLNSRSLVVDENGDPELWTLTRGFLREKNAVAGSRAAPWSASSLSARFVPKSRYSKNRGPTATGSRALVRVLGLVPTGSPSSQDRERSGGVKCVLKDQALCQ